MLKKDLTPVQINNAINNFNFAWRIDDKEVEEESYANLVKLISDHYGPLAAITSEVHETVAKLIYKKLPTQHQSHNQLRRGSCVPF